MALERHSSPGVASNAQNGPPFPASCRFNFVARGLELTFLVDKKEAAITALRSIVELRDVAGRVMNPEIHATGRAGDRDAAMPARRFQFDLRTLLLFMLFASAALSWYGIYYRRDSAEKAALARLDPFKPQIISGPGLLWVDFSASAIKPGDHDLALLSELVTLDNLNLSGAPITDAGLEYLAHLEFASPTRPVEHGSRRRGVAAPGDVAAVALSDANRHAGDRRRSEEVAASRAQSRSGSVMRGWLDYGCAKRSFEE